MKQKVQCEKCKGEIFYIEKDEEEMLTKCKACGETAIVCYI